MALICGETFLMENHDEALRVWRQSGMMGRILVHVDAHHDLGWLKDPTKQPVNIANFICIALKEKLVREMIWVTPDGAWESKPTERPVRQQVRDLISRYPRSSPIQEHGPGAFSFQLLGVTVYVCRLGTLPSVAAQEPVLLDLDVDFMLIPHPTTEPLDEHCDTPWITPADLLSALETKGVRPLVATIAYSVNGGYTPLRWKHLGDELFARLQGHPVAAPGPLNYDTPYVNMAFPLLQCGLLDRAEVAFQEVLALDPENAWATFGLGLIASRRGQWTLAETRLRESLKRNGTMTDAWRALAQILEKDGRTAEAIAAYERSLLLALKGHHSLWDAILTPGVDVAAQDEGHGIIHARLARLYERCGDLRRATTGYLIAAQSSRFRTTIQLRLARLYARQKRFRQSVNALGRGAALIPSDLLRGFHRIRQGRWSM